MSTAPGLSRSPSSARFPLFFGEGSPTKIDYRKKATSLLEDLVVFRQGFQVWGSCRQAMLHVGVQVPAASTENHS